MRAFGKLGHYPCHPVLSSNRLPKLHGNFVSNRIYQCDGWLSITCSLLYVRVLFNEMFVSFNDMSYLEDSGHNQIIFFLVRKQQDEGKKTLRASKNT